MDKFHKLSDSECYLYIIDRALWILLEYNDAV
jgi:hypothetical protein